MLGLYIFEPAHLGTLLLLAMLTCLCDAQLIRSLCLSLQRQVLYLHVSQIALRIDTLCLLCRSQPDRGALRWPFSAWQIAAAAPILAFHGLIAYRMTYVSFGWPAVLFSPGLAWCTPLISLLLYAHYRRREPLPASKKTQ